MKKTHVGVPRRRRGGVSRGSLLLLGIGLLAANADAAVNHRPTISWIKDQRIGSGSFVGQSFTVGDDTTLAGDLVVTQASTNGAWYPASNIIFTGTLPNLVVNFANTPTVPGATTIRLTVTDTGSPQKSAATSFTLQVAADTGAAPVIQGVANQSLAKDSSTGPISLTVKDDDSEEATLSLSASVSSTNASLLPAGSIVFGGDSWGRTVTINPATGQVGRATVTFTVSDGPHSTSTSCIVDVVGGTNLTAPSFTSVPTHHVRKLNDPSSAMTFTISDLETAAADLRVTATSSDTTVVPNSGLALSGTTGTRSITVTPTGGKTGAVTITLTLSDGDILRSATYLFVVRNPNAAATIFDRSSGVFVLDGLGDTQYTTNFGRLIRLRDENIRALDFVNGFALRVDWQDIERGGQPATPDEGYDFFIIANLLDKLPAGQVLSLSHVGPEPNNIADTATTRWTDVGPDGVAGTGDDGETRAVPWDPFLRERRKALIEVMAASKQTLDGIALGVHPKLALIHTYLPGGSTGIRDPDFQNQPLSSLPGYTRQTILDTVRDELILWQHNFPGKLVQIGFWPVLDGEDEVYGEVAHEWLRQQLAAEFNGTTRPRVGFFQENLAASRPGPNVNPFTGSPLTADVGTVLHASRNLTWNSFQMLGSWSKPFSDDHVDNMLNGSPNDALQYAHNTYNSHYAEAYVDDIDNLALQPALRSWHDYLATFAAPMGLDVRVISTTQIDVQWEAVTGASGYQLQRQDGPGALFAQIFAGSATSFTDTVTSTTSGVVYAYRVRASISPTNEAPAGGNTSWSAPLAAVLPTLKVFSVALDDGNVSASGNVNSSGGTGDIKAGEGTVVVSGEGSDTIKGILSFDTSELPDNGVVTKVTLRLRERGQTGNPFTLIGGGCKVDIKSGTFGGTALEAGDFSAAASATNVGNVPDVSDDVWAEVTLSGAALVYVNRTGLTQLRIYFDDVDLAQNNVRWYPGDTTSRPELIVEYIP